MSADVGSAVGYLDLDIQGFLNGLHTAQSEADKASQSVNSALSGIGGNMEAAGKKMTAAGTFLTKGVTVPVFALGGAIVKTSADFESSMSKVAAISGATGEDFDALSAKAREMGSKTKFSASESAEALQYMAMAGWDVDSMLGGISGVMNLAAASGEELGAVSDIVTDAMTAFGLSAKGTSTVLKDGLNVEVDNTTRFVDALAAASNSSNTNVAMLGESFKYVAPVAGALGYSVEDVAVALGLMANQGIKSSQSGTALRTMFTNMANPTDTMASAMNALGVSLENDDGSMKSLMEVMTDLRKGFGGGKMDADEFKKSITEMDTAFQNGEMSQEGYEAAINDLCVAMYGAEGAQKAQIAAQLAGKTGMAGLLAIVNSTDEDFQSLTESIYNASGTSQEMADIMQDNVSGQLTILKSMLEELALQFGEVLLPVMRKFVEWLQGIVAKLQELSPEQREQIVKWAAIAAAVGPVLIVFGKLVTSVGGMITTFGKIPAMITKLKSGFLLLSAAIGGISLPVVAIVAAIGVLIAAFVSLWKNNEDFRNKITAIWDGIKEKFEGFTSGIVERLNALGFNFESITEVIGATWKGFCDLLAPVFEGAFAIIADTLGYALDTILNVFDIFVGVFTGDWDKVWNGIKGIFEDTWNFIENIFVNVWDTIKGVFDTALGWFGTSWDELWTNVGQFFVDTWNGIKQFFVDTWNSIVSFFTEGIPVFVENAKQMGSQFLENIVLFFQELPFKIGEFIGLAIGTVAKWVIDMVDKAKEMGTNFINAVVEFFTTLPGKIAEFITKAYNSVVKWATDMPSKAKEMGRNFIDSVVKFFSELPGKIWDWLTKAINKVKQWVIDMGTNGTKAIKNLIDNVVNGAKEIPGKMLQIGKNIVEGIWSGIQNAAAWFSDQVSSFFSGLVNGIKKGLGISSPSKVFADQIGKWLPPGIANGFRSALPEAINKMQSDIDKSALSLKKDLQVEQDISANSFMEFLGGFDGAVGRFTESVQRLLNAGREFVYTGLFNERSSASKDVVGGQYRNDIKIDITVEAKVASDYDVQNLGKELGVSVERELRSKGVAVV